MIRKYFMLAAVLFLFLFTVLNFYSEALVYDPMSVISIKQPKLQEAKASVSTYSTAWSSDILEKNLFSSRRGPKPSPPPPPPPPPPKRPELSLRGIVQNTSGEYVGYLEIDKAGAAPIKKGDKIRDIEVVDISERNVVLQWMGEKINMSIEHVTTVDSPTNLKGNAAVPGGQPPQPSLRTRRRLGRAPANIAPPPTAPVIIDPSQTDDNE